MAAILQTFLHMNYFFLAATKQLYEWFSPSVCLPVHPRKQRVSLQLMTSCCMNFAIIIQWIYFTIWEKIKKNSHHYNTILSFYNIKILQEELAKKSNIPWIWRIIYGHKLPYMKKTGKKQVCGAACFMAAEIKFSKDVRPSHLFDYVPVIVSSWNFWGVITSDKSDVHAKVQGQRSKVKVTEVKT